MHPSARRGTVSRRRVLAATAGLVTTAAVAGCLGDSGSDGPPTGPVATAPLPDDPSASEYAVMGEADAPMVTYYGNWKCPHCATFGTEFMEDIVTDYVEPGDVRLRFRGMAYTGDGQPFLGPDAVTATRAGLAVWTAEPESYWPYHHQVFANQPSERQEWATADRLVEFAETAGVEATDAIRTAIDEGRYQSLIEASTRDAFDAGVQGTPTLVIDGTAVSPFEEDRTRSLLDSLSN